MLAHSSLTLSFEGREVARVSIDTRLGKSSFKRTHEDAAYLSDPQFRLYRQSDGAWWIEHAPGATNETIVDGSALSAPRKVYSGMQVAVGNSSKGVQKFSLLCDVGSSGEPVETSIERPIAWQLPEKVRATVGRMGAKLSAVDWATGFSRIARAIAPIAGFIATLGGAVFMGLLRGLGSETGSRGTCVRRGNSTFGDVILNVEGKRIRAGSSSFGTVLMTIEGNQLRDGDSMFGTVLATLDGNQVREGSLMFGNVIATIEGNQVREGSSMFGDVIATIDGGGRMAGAAAAVYLLRM